MADTIKPDRGAPGAPAAPGPIPGERDPSTLTHREPGAVGGRFAGADVPSPDRHTWLDERTAQEKAWEGGGSAVRKPGDTKSGKVAKKRTTKK